MPAVIIKLLLVFLFLINSLFTFGQEEGNYIITIDGKKMDIDLEKEYSFKNKNGSEVKFTVEQKDILLFKDEKVSFKYYAEHSVASTEVGDGITQLTLITANGSGFIIQKYSTLNPVSLVDLMMQEITKESISYGYKETSEVFKHSLASGQSLEGKTSVLKYQEDEQSYTVATYGSRDSGILVMTMINSDNKDKDQKILDLFMKTLQIHESKE
jgi:hypothetical protein